MIKAILLDLDDTLIYSNTGALFPAYLRLLGLHGADIALPGEFAQQVLDSYLQVLKTYAPTQSLYERFFEQFESDLGCVGGELHTLFEDFYRERYADLRSYVHANPHAHILLDWLFDQGYKVVIATNPGLPETSILQRMEWAGIPAHNYPFALVTSLETMHFGKPFPEYYEEILARLDLETCEAIVVGDNWEQDILGATAIGLCAFWISENDALPDDSLAVDGHGSFEHFAKLVQEGWLDTLKPHQPNYQALISRLAAFPAAIDTLLVGHSCKILECSLGEKEWSARDIVCHLRDHEVEVDRMRLERIAQDDGPFLSGDYDPWACGCKYADTSIHLALGQFAQHRGKTIDWLRSLPKDTWRRTARHAVFGPTCFEEMVKFTTEHDRIHLRQMRSALNYALTICGN